MWANSCAIGSDLRKVRHESYDGFWIGNQWTLCRSETRLAVLCDCQRCVTFVPAGCRYLVVFSTNMFTCYGVAVAFCCVETVDRQPLKVSFFPLSWRLLILRWYLQIAFRWILTLLNLLWLLVVPKSPKLSFLLCVFLSRCHILHNYTRNVCVNLDQQLHVHVIMKLDSL